MNVYKIYLKEKDARKKRKKKMEFSKKLLVWLLGWANIILTYAMVAMWRFENLDSLNVLISVVGLEIIAAVVWYMKKSAAENVVKIRKGGNDHEYGNLSDQEEYQTE